MQVPEAERAAAEKRRNELFDFLLFLNKDKDR